MSAVKGSAAAAAELRGTRVRLGASVEALRGRLRPSVLRAGAAAAAKQAASSGWEKARGAWRRHPLGPVVAVFALGLLLGVAVRRR